MKAQRIRVQPRGASHPAGVTAVISGWLGTDGPSTYLWLGYRDAKGEHAIGILDGAQLYRLAKAVVRRFEQSSQLPDREKT